MIDEETSTKSTLEHDNSKKSSKRKRTDDTGPSAQHDGQGSTTVRASDAPGEVVSEAIPSGPRSSDPMMALIRQEKFEEILSSLRTLDRVTDDKGQEVPFAGPAKEEFIKDVAEAYPVFGAALGSLYETGRFLYEVRERQMKNKLWTKFQETTGQSKSFINNYIRVYEKFRERLSEFSHLGVSKLEVVARLKEPVAYIEANKDVLEKASFKEVRRIVTAEKEKAVRHRTVKSKDTYEEVGSYRLKLSANGRFLTILDLNKERQNELVKLLKHYLSQEK